MSLLRNFKLYHLSIVGAMAVAVVAIIFANDVHFRLNFLNSDTMYQQSVYKDLFIEGGSWKHWSYNAAPNIFPDFIFISILMFLTKSPAMAGLLAGVLQFGIINLLFIEILKRLQILSDNTKLALIPVVTFILFFPTIFQQEIEHGFQMLSNSYHLGAFVNTLILLFFISKNILSPQKTIGLVLFASLAAISDRVFWVMFCAPLFVLAFIFLKQKNRISFFRYLALSILPILAALLFAAIIRSIKGPEIEKAFREFSWENVIPSLTVFVQVIKELLLSKNWRTLVYAAIIISVILISIKALKSRLKIESASDFFFLFAVVSILSTIAAPILNGSFESLQHLRYQMGAFIFTFLILGLLIAQKTKSNNILKYAIVTLSVFPIVTCVVHANEVKRKFTFYPSFTQEVDEIAKRYRLKNGISTYWNAKLDEQLSRSGIHVVATYSEPLPDIHANSRDWYVHDRLDRTKPAVFNFVIINDAIHLEKVKEVFTFGTSLVKYGESEVLITPPFTYDEKLQIQFLDGEPSNHHCR